MKKSGAFLFFLFFAVISVFSQSRSDFFVKWSPASLAAGKITLGSEYNFKKKNSIEFFVGIPSSVTHSVTYDKQKNDIKFKAFSLFAGYRRYLGKKSASGLYIEPFVKYLKHEGSGILDGTLSGQAARFDTKSTYEGIGAGLQLGVQFIIAKRVSLDFFFLGPEANSGRLNSSATDIGSSLPWTYIQAEEAEADIRDAIKDLPLVGKKMEIVVDQDQKTVYTKYQGILPGFRIGMSLGIRL